MRPPPKKRRGVLSIGLLLAANVAVVLYHGDPFEVHREGAKAGVASALERAPNSEEEGAPVAEQNEAEATPSAAEMEETGAIDGAEQLDDASADALPAEEIDQMGPPANLASFNPLAGMRSPGLVQKVETLTLGSNQTAAGALMDYGLDGEVVQAAISSLTPHFDFRLLRRDDPMKVRLDAKGELVSLEVSRGLLERARADLSDDTWNGKRIDVQVDTVPAEISGVVESSLWNAIIGSGESPALVSALVEVFAWDIDFYTEVRGGDSFRLLTEKRYVDGQFLDYGPVVAAEYVNEGEKHRAFLYEVDESVSYYDPDGRSMKKQLLKAPLKYGRVTSTFGSRRHPVLGYTRAHNGIDYGVPTGTPVWSVGDGRVVRAGRHGGYGNLVEVRHANGWLSQYAHLSKIKVRVGERVQQKQTVGLVGSTGLATGPHLHYGLKQNNRYVNPLVQKFERGKPLAGADLDTFRRHVAELEQRLNQVQVAQRVAAESQEG